MTDLFSTPIPSLPSELRAVAEMIDAASRERPVKNAVLCAATGLSERSVKDAVEKLRREHYWPVLGSKKPPYGYYVATSAEELEEAARGLVDQAVTMIRTARVMAGAERVREMLGQLRIEEAA